MRLQPIPKRKTGTLKIHGRSYTFKSLLPIDFMEIGYVPFSLFEFESREGGLSESMNDMEKTEEDTKKNIDFIFKSVLTVAINDFDYDFELEIIGEENIRLLAEYIIQESLEYISCIKKPSKSFLLSCYALAHKFGGKPYDYATDSIEAFIFNQLSLTEGLKEQERLDKIEEAKRKNR